MAKANSDIYDYYKNRIEFQPELLAGLNVTLQNRIKDIKTFSKCEQCGAEYRLRYKYRSYLEGDNIEFCDKCIIDIALDYIVLRNLSPVHAEMTIVEFIKGTLKFSNIVGFTTPSDHPTAINKSCNHV